MFLTGKVGMGGGAMGSDGERRRSYTKDIRVGGAHLQKVLIMIAGR